MIIGIVSDVHCNVRGLERALKEMGPVDLVLCAGDLVYDYRFSNDIVDVIREQHILTVLGNHDFQMLSPNGDRARHAASARQDNIEFMTNLPKTVEISLNGKRLFMAHGSPWNPIGEYLFFHSDKIKRLTEIQADFVVLGHTHYPGIQRVDNVLVINPGSCGEARDPSWKFQLTYAVLDVESGQAEIRAFEDPDESRGTYFEGVELDEHTSSP